jgi:hypothetical protein
MSGTPWCEPIATIGSTRLARRGRRHTGDDRASEIQLQHGPAKIFAETLANRIAAKYQRETDTMLTEMRGHLD